MDSPADSQPFEPRFPLGSAIFPGFPHAPDCTSPTQYAPDSWRKDFEDQHQDGAVLSGLHTTCRAGRDYALQTADQATLRLDTTQEKPSAEWLKQLCAVKSGLKTRGPKDTSLQLLCDAGPASGARLMSIVAELQDSLVGINGLEFKTKPGCLDGDACTLFLRGASPFLPRLEHIIFDGTACPLPPPTVAPNVWELRVWLDGSSDNQDLDTLNDVFTSIGPWLQQLVSLEIQVSSWLSWEMDLTAWPRALFNAGQTTTTLTKLGLSYVLDDTLMTLILAHTPALVFLDVFDIGESLGDYSGREWLVTVFKLLAVPQAGHLELGKLPRSKSGNGVIVESAMGPVLPLITGEYSPLLVFVGALADLVQAKLLDPDFRLSEWFFDDPPFLLAPLPQDPSLLTPTLKTLRAARSKLMLLDWPWTIKIAKAAATAITQSQFTRVSVNVPTLTDELLGALLHMGSAAYSLMVGKLELVTDQHSNVAWPRQEFAVDEKERVDFAELLRLPDPSKVAGGKPPMLCCDFDFTPTLREIDTEALKSRLRHLRYQGNQISLIYGGDIVTLLRSQTDILQAMRYDNINGPGPLDIIPSWPINHITMATLRDLPEWQARLQLSSCSWPLNPHEYTKFAQCVPATCTEWHFGDRVQPQLLEVICEGVNEHREGLGGAATDGAVAVYAGCHEGVEKRFGKHVVVRSATEWFQPWAQSA